MKISALIVILSFPISAAACWDALNENIRQTGEKLINKTKTIALAKVYKKETQGDVSELITYYFENIEILKGNVTKYFDTTLYEVAEYTDHTSFNHHTDKLFWKRNLGRVGYADESCTRPIPRFIVGRTYLLFNGSKDSKAYEVIDDTKKDKWYLFVRQHIKETHNKANQRGSK